MKLHLAPQQLCFRIGQRELEQLMREHTLIEKILLPCGKHIEYYVQLSEQLESMQVKSNHLSVGLIVPIKIMQELIRARSKEGYKHTLTIGDEQTTVLLQINLKSNS